MVCFCLPALVTHELRELGRREYQVRGLSVCQESRPKYTRAQTHGIVRRVFVTPPLPAPPGVVASARLCCLSRVPPAVCSSLLESTTTVCTTFLLSLSTYVHTPTPHSILRFRPAPQTPDLHTSNLPLDSKRSHPDFIKN